VLLLGLSAVLLGQGGSTTSGVDLLQYWSASKLLLQGSNPYSAQSMTAIQLATWRGGAIPIPIMMWNPPQIFSLIFFIGKFNFPTLVVGWQVLALAIMIGATLTCYHLYNRGGALPRAALLSQLIFFASFPPFYVSLHAGQISPILLLGLVGYLYLDARRGETVSNSFWGGMLLSLTLLKPHLLYLVYLYIFVASLKNKTWLTLAGLACGFAVMALPALLLESNIWSYYLNATASAPPIYWKTPTVGSMLQGLLDYHKVWVRMLPTIITSVLALGLWFKSGALEFSSKQILILIPISLLTSPYGWIFDQMLMLPLLAFIFAKLNGRMQNEPQVFRFVMLVALGANLIAALIPANCGHEYFVWYPLVVIALGFFVRCNRYPVTKFQCM